MPARTPTISAIEAAVTRFTAAHVAPFAPITAGLTEKPFCSPSGMTTVFATDTTSDLDCLQRGISSSLASKLGVSVGCNSDGGVPSIRLGGVSLTRLSALALLAAAASFRGATPPRPGGGGRGDPLGSVNRAEAGLPAARVDSLSSNEVSIAATIVATAGCDVSFGDLDTAAGCSAIAAVPTAVDAI